MTATSSISNLPKAVVEAPEGYSFIGGGAQVLSNPAGNYLTLTAPHDENLAEPLATLWFTKSKAHKANSPAQITAWGIAFLRSWGYGDGSSGSQIDGWGILHWQARRDMTGNSTNGGIRSKTIYPDTEWAITCPGAYATWTEGAGRMLIGVHPWYSGATATSKDHLTGSGGAVYPSFVQVRKHH